MLIEAAKEYIDRLEADTTAEQEKLAAEYDAQIDKLRYEIQEKAQKITKKYKFHDEANAANPGDVVRIIETRPLSREKCWDLLEIVTKSEQV